MVSMDQSHEGVAHRKIFSMSPMSRQKLRAELQIAAFAAADRQDLEEAIDLYGQAINIYVEGDDKSPQCFLLSRRASCNSELLRFELALDDSVASLELLEDSTIPESFQTRRSTIYAAGCAAYHMGDFRKALTFFESLQNLVPESCTAAMLERVRVRLEEQSSGKYDFEQMLEHLIKNPRLTRLDHASFISNTEIRTTVTSGRGLFATKDFKLGELVLCEKAFAIEFERADGQNRLPELQSQVVQILKYSPAAKTQFYTLTDGEYGPARHPGKISFPAQARSMVRLNGFEFVSISTWHGMRKEERYGSQRGGAGTLAVWIRASLFNHSCVANVKRSHVGDMMIVRAAKPIAKGEELCISYLNSSIEFHDRRQFLENWSFECHCKRCQADGILTDEQHDRRVSLIEEATPFLRAMYDDHAILPCDVQQAESLLLQLRSTYDNPAYEGIPHLPLIDLGRFLAENYVLGRFVTTNELGTDMAKAEETTVTLLTDLGLVRKDPVEGIMLDLAGATDTPEYSMGVALLAARMLHKEKMRGHKNIFIGLSKELYKTLYGTVYDFESFADPNKTGWLDRLDVEAR